MTTPSSTDRTFVLVFGAALVVYLVLALTSSWLCDDAYIAFRYSSNFADGHGLRFNLGVEPPVEGYTQLGWVLWMSIFEWLDLDPRFWARATGIVAGALLLYWVTRFARKRLNLGTIPTAAAALFFATSPTVCVWSTGGLGTMPFALAIFIACERLLGDLDRPHLAQAVAAALLAALLRVDGIYWLGLIFASGVVIAKLTQRPALLRKTLLCAGIVAAAIAIQIVWRLFYYGDWLPNTARAKVGLSWPALQRGFDYTFTYWLTIPSTLIVLLLSLPLARRREEWWLRISAVIAAATFAYGVLVGGDFMAMGRFMLPAIPFLALAVGRLIERVDAITNPLPAVGATAALIAGSLPALFGGHLTPQSWREAVMFRWGKDYKTEFEFWQGMTQRARQWSNLGRALALHTAPGESLVRGAIGAVGYYSGLFIYDQLGLVNRDVVEKIVVDPDNLKIPGHDRFANQQFFAPYRPTYIDARLYYIGAREAAEPGIPQRILRLAGSRPLARIFPVYQTDGLPLDGYLVVWRYP